MGALVPPELQWVGEVDSGFFFFPPLGMGFSRGWSWRSAVWRSEVVGRGQQAAETMDLKQRAGLCGHIWEKCRGRSMPYFGYK